MRYHDNGKPWPLAERLWEAKRGLWVGAVMAGMLLVCVLVVVEAVSFVLKSQTGSRVPLGAASLVFLYRWGWLVLIVCVGGMYRNWMRDLELVNEETESFEELVIRRLNAIEDKVSNL
jgi:uncharacterized membrane protein YqhA